MSPDPLPRDLGTLKTFALLATAVASALALYVGAVGVICLGIGALIDVPAVVKFGAWIGSIALLSLMVIASLLAVAAGRRWWRGDRPVFPKTKAPR